MGETDSFVGDQLLGTHLLYKVHFLFWAHRDSPIAKTINTLTAFPIPFFLRDQVFAWQIKTKEEIFWVELGQLLDAHLLYNLVHSLFST